jgi:hypothetical protein
VDPWVDQVILCSHTVKPCYLELDREKHFTCLEIQDTCNGGGWVKIFNNY